jgi:hypothetical protein
LSQTPLPASTLACGGAPATVKPGIGPASALTGTALTAILGLFGAAEAGVIFDVVLAGVNFDLFEICNAGDPGDVTLTVQDYADALNVAVPSVNLPAVAKFHQWIAHAMFPQWCNCADGTSPPPATPSVPPPYVPNPGAPSGASGTQNCYQSIQTGYYATPGGLQWPYAAWYWVDGAAIAADSPRLVIPGTSLIQLDVQYFRQGTSDPTIGAFGSIAYYNQAGQQIASVQGPPGPGGQDTVTLTLAPPTGAYKAAVLPNTVSNAPTYPPGTLKATVTVFCGTQGPGTPSVPCCPPDPTVDIRLRSIQDMLQFLMDGTKPSYKAGTVHTGVTGAGTLAISNLVGVKIDITSGVPTNPELPGTPPYEFSVGWMSVSEPNGMLDEKRITRQHQVWLSGVTPYATVFGYYLNPGFTINVTELVPA